MFKKDRSKRTRRVRKRFTRRRIVSGTEPVKIPRALEKKSDLKRVSLEGKIRSALQTLGQLELSQRERTVVERIQGICDGSIKGRVTEARLKQLKKIAKTGESGCDYIFSIASMSSNCRPFFKTWTVAWTRASLSFLNSSDFALITGCRW